MPIYQYKARDEEGRLISGRMDVVSKDDLHKRLENYGFFLVSSSEEKKNFLSADLNKLFQRITLRSLHTFTLQLANTLNAGVPMLRSLRSIADGCKNQKLAMVLEKVIEDLRSGSSYSESLSKHPKVFSSFYTSMVELGESSGTLPKMLYSIAEYIKKNIEIKRKITAALTYPIVLALVGLGIVMYILIYIMPMFIEIFVEEGVALPTPTAILIAIRDFFVGNWQYLLLLTAGLVFGFRTYILTQKGRQVIDRVKLGIPLAGQVIKKMCVKRFVDGLYLLYTGGLPILKALNIVKATLSNKHLEKIIDALWVHISRGQDLASYLCLTDFFPSEVLTMIKSGEESGTLGLVLEKVSEIYQDDINYSIERLMSFIEIGIILIMGVGVGFIAISILFPIFSLSQAISGR